MSSKETGDPVEGSIPFWEPEIGGNEWKYVKECLDTKWISSVGSFVERFERETADYVGADHAVAVSNGTVGLHLALRVVGVLPGDEVLVSNLTFVAPVNAVSYCRAYPVLMDADPVTWQMDVRKVERFLQEESEIRSGECFNKRTGRRIRAIVPVHILGLACRIDEIVSLAARYGIQVVEDAAEAIGVRFCGRHVGTFGDIGIFSFNGNKIATAGGGGILVTANGNYAQYARYLSTQAKDDALEYVHNEIGYNYRMTNLNAAVGVAQLERVEEFVRRKQQIARVYEQALKEVPGITTMPTPPETVASYWLYTVLLGEDTDLKRRKEIVARLNAHGVGSRPIWRPINCLDSYRGSQSFEIEHSTRLYERALSLPSSSGLRVDQIRRCVDLLDESVRD